MIKLCIFTLICSLWNMPLYSKEPSLTILTEEWAPFNYKENGVLKGFSTEIVKSIMMRLGIVSRIQINPGSRSLYILDNEPYALFFSLYRTAEREEKYKWVGPLASGSISFYKRKEDLREIRTLEDAKAVDSVSCRYAGLVFRLLQQEGFENIDNTAKDSYKVYEKVLFGRNDLAVGDTDPGFRYVLDKLGYPSDSLVRTPVVLYDADLYIAFNKDTPDEVIDQWQSALDIIKADGIYKSIADKYYVQLPGNRD